MTKGKIPEPVGKYRTDHYKHYGKKIFFRSDFTQQGLNRKSGNIGYGYKENKYSLE